MVKSKFLLFLAAVALTSCSFPPPEKEDGRCLDGYLVYTVSEHPIFLGFCRKVTTFSGGIYGETCYDGPPEGPTVEMNLLATNAYFGKTSCYNVIRDHK
jgi:hypothetical protein